MKLKRVLLAIFSLGVVICAATGFSACAKENAHEHAYGEWTDFAVTCEERLQKRVCEECGNEQVQSLQAGGHTYGEWADLVNICEFHAQKRVCSECGNEQTQTLEAKGHAYGVWTDLVNTCTEHVQKRVCGCGKEQTKTLPVTGHKYGEWTDIVDTCEKHVQKRICSTCSNEEMQIIDAAGHKYGEWTDLVNTCEDYAQKRVCSECKSVETRELEASGHKYTFWQDMINTCERRVQRSVCTECRKEQTQELKAEGHKFAGGVCEVCGVAESSATLAKYNSNYGLNYFAYNGFAEECELYCRIDNAVRIFHTNGKDGENDGYGNFVFAEIELADSGLTSDRAVSVWKTYKDDNPLYYWLANSVLASGGKLTLLVEEEYSDGTKRKETNDFVYAEAAKYAALTNENDDAYRIALCYHDAIINAVDYAYDEYYQPQSEAWAHNILGVFEKKGAVCEAYARTFQLLLNYSGIENIFVAGETSTSGAHAWNLVKLDDNNWYWCDLTWDDTPDWEWGISYNYFMVNDTQDVNWSDSPVRYGEGPYTKSFTQLHVVNTANGSAQDFLYDLPKRAKDVYSANGNNLLRDTFEVGDMTYAVTGYDTVQLVNVKVKGDVVIPETVTAEDGNTYTVISVGKIKDGLFEEGFVLDGSNRKVTVSLPATVRFIWDRALTGYFNPNCFVSGDFIVVPLSGETLSCPITVINYCVDADNNWFKTVDGVLFTKSMKTLIAYPAANKRDSYVIPDSVEQIVYGAFINCFNLYTLDIGRGVKETGVLCWGMAYENLSGGIQVLNIMEKGLASIWGNMVNDAVIIVRNNPNYVKEFNVIYRVYDDGSREIAAEYQFRIMYA